MQVKPHAAAVWLAVCRSMGSMFDVRCSMLGRICRLHLDVYLRQTVQHLPRIDSTVRANPQPAHFTQPASYALKRQRTARIVK